MKILMKKYSSKILITIPYIIGVETPRPGNYAIKWVSLRQTLWYLARHSWVCLLVKSKTNTLCSGDVSWPKISNTSLRAYELGNCTKRNTNRSLLAASIEEDTMSWYQGIQAVELFEKKALKIASFVVAEVRTTNNRLTKNRGFIYRPLLTSASLANGRDQTVTKFVK